MKVDNLKIGRSFCVVGLTMLVAIQITMFILAHYIYIPMLVATLAIGYGVFLLFRVCVKDGKEEENDI